MKVKIAALFVIIAATLIAVAMASRITRAATIHASSATVSSVTCTTPYSGSAAPSGSVQTTVASGQAPYVECFVTWSDGTRCVSLVGQSTLNGGASGSSALQCAFSGVVGVP